MQSLPGRAFPPLPRQCFGMGTAACSSSAPPAVQDVRDEYGKWLLASVAPVYEGSQRVKVHFEGWDAKYDTVLDYVVSRDMFAPAHKYSSKKNAARNPFQLREDVLIRQRRPHRENGWKRAKITKIDGGQVQTAYFNASDSTIYKYWYHFLQRGEIKPDHSRTKEEGNEPRPAPRGARVGVGDRVKRPRQRAVGQEDEEGGAARSSSSSVSSGDEGVRWWAAARTGQGSSGARNRPGQRRQRRWSGGGMSGAASNTNDTDLCCDRCNKRHRTGDCPHYKKARPKHRDAWVNKGRKTPLSMGKSGGKFVLSRARVVRQPGDGNCLFHSLSYQLGTDAYSLRQRICRFIADHGDLEIGGDPIRDWVEYDSGLSVRAYARRMSRSGRWGGGIEIAACMHLNHTNVHVYERSWRGYKRISCFEVDGANRTVHLLYGGRAHYDALLPDR